MHVTVEVAIQKYDRTYDMHFP